MAVSVKFAGLMAVLFCTTLIGVTKAAKLKKRAEKLRTLCFSLQRFSELIKCGNTELDRLVTLCFGTDTAVFNNGKLRLSSENFTPEDILLFDGIARDIGTGDAETEARRISALTDIMENQYKSAEKNVTELCRLYTSTGFLSGLAICIFLL